METQLSSSVDASFLEYGLDFHCTQVTGNSYGLSLGWDRVLMPGAGGQGKAGRQMTTTLTGVKRGIPDGLLLADVVFGLLEKAPAKKVPVMGNSECQGPVAVKN